MIEHLINQKDKEYIITEIEDQGMFRFHKVLLQVKI